MPSYNEFKQVDLLRTRQADPNVESREAVEISPVEQVQTALKPESLKEAPGNPGEEKTDLLMKNIKEFIRSIDVKSL